MWNIMRVNDCGVEESLSHLFFECSVFVVFYLNDVMVHTCKFGGLQVR
jgi:hypothetical protein